MNVLYLDQTELATKDDEESGLVMWSELFKATTWEELNTIATGNHFMEEVADCMYTANIIDQEKTYIEAHQRFLDQKRGAYDAGLKTGEVRFLITTICDNMKQGRKLEEIKSFLRSDPDTVSKIYDIAIKYSPDFDYDKIFNELNTSV